MATQVFAEEELERLRGFPEIGRDELFRFSPWRRRMLRLSIPVAAEGPRIGWGCPWRCARCCGSENLFRRAVSYAGARACLIGQTFGAGLKRPETAASPTRARDHHRQLFVGVGVFVGSVGVRCRGDLP